MDAKITLLFCCILVALTVNVSASTKHKIVAYWGQNAVYNQLKARQYWEKDLIDFCRDYNYDIIVLSFLNVFFETANKDNMPGFNFAFHCETPVTPDYPKMLRCPKIEAGIKECQKNGKQVLMSLGGAVGRVGFNSVNEAKLFAYRVYHLLLEGNDLQSIRPFGSAVLNGIDLDIENGRYEYYTEFVQELRRLEKIGQQKILIGAAPQCPYPDRLLGPSTGHVLGDVPQSIDEIYIQFYNNWCHTGNKRVFYDHVKQWVTYSKNNNGPIIFVGVPANTRASGNAQHYRPPQELAEIYQNLRNESRFGGIMIWDASFDQNNVINGSHYSEYIKEMFNNGGKPITLPPTTTTTTTTTTTQPPAPDTTVKPGPVTTMEPGPVTTAGPNCKDDYPRSCPHWVSICETHRYIAVLCKRTCNLC